MRSTWMAKTAIILLVLFLPFASARGISPKVKAVLTMSAYGAVGGGLFGLALIPFGGPERVILKGASIGFYTGLLFGGYILFNHHYGLEEKDEYFGGEAQPNSYPSDIDQLRFWQQLTPSSRHPKFQIELFRLTF